MGIYSDQPLLFLQYRHAGADYRGGGHNIFKLRALFFAPPRTIFAPLLFSYYKGGQTFVSFIHHDLFILCCFGIAFFYNSESDINIQ